ncbi:MAG: 5,10-methylenetetrahydrofolate reductase, partial [Woeseia sp.]|nr:5,10-methylenetetrahydrofolate reductase [Woeseia sp.]
MSFRDALRQKDFVVAAELPLVPTSSRESIIADAGILAGTVDGLLFTDNQYGQPHMSPSFAAAVAKEAGFSPILQLGCRNRNRIALIGEILGAKGLDIDTLM